MGNRIIEIETQQSDAYPYCHEWQLLVAGECVAGGERSTEFEAVQRAVQVSYEWESDTHSDLIVNGVQV